MNTVIALILLPLLWSHVVFAIRAVAPHRRAELSDATEKAHFLLMLAPFVAGIILLALPMPAPHVMTQVLPRLPTFEPKIMAQKVMRFTPPAHQSFLAETREAGIGPRVAVTLIRLSCAHLRYAHIAARATPMSDGVYQTQAATPAFAWNGRRFVIPQNVGYAKRFISTWLIAGSAAWVWMVTFRITQRSPRTGTGVSAIAIYCASCSRSLSSAVSMKAWSVAMGLPPMPF
jgi:hypothetical protein